MAILILGKHQSNLLKEDQWVAEQLKIRTEQLAIIFNSEISLCCTQNDEFRLQLNNKEMHVWNNYPYDRKEAEDEINSIAGDFGGNGIDIVDEDDDEISSEDGYRFSYARSKY